MRVFRDLEALPPFKNAVITIGSYDGVHTGHQEIIRRINALAKEIDGESILITFHPHPRLFLYPNDTSLQLLNTLDEKIDVLKKLGIDNLVIVPFDKTFAVQSPKEYILDFLHQKFTPKRIVIGYDHRFGNKRKGDLTLLKSFETQCGFKVEEIQKQTIADIAISSTKIRKAIIAGQIRKANDYLQHSFTISGKVVGGQQLGRTMGFPTANIEVESRHKLMPQEGIYAVKICHQSIDYQGMLYIGNRPTLNGQSQSIEVNIFDFNQSIYGDFLKIELIQHIRGDQKFDSLPELVEQLKQDEIDALAILNN